MLSLTNVVSAIFTIFPTAKIAGKYVIYYIQGRIELIDRIDIILNPCRMSPSTLEEFERILGSYFIEFEEKAEFEGLTPTQYQFTLRSTNLKEIFLIKISTDLGAQCHLSIGNLTIDVNGQIEPRMSNVGERYLDDVGELHGQSNTDFRDILDRTVRFIKPLNSIMHSVDRKYSYLRVLDLMTELIKNDGPELWNFYSQQERNVLNIYPYVDGMDIENGSSPEDQEYVCPICRDDFDTGDMCIVLKCEHKYHTHCLMNNLSGVGPNSDTCPICRDQII